ncbi:MAG: hypothetical protein ACKO96_16070, partial [Flammeovirgaceae bacterium]
MADQFNIDETLANQFRELRKAKRNKTLNAIFGTTGAAAGAVAGYDPMAFIRLIGEPMMGDDPSSKAASAEAINDLIKQKRDPSLKAQEGKATRAAKDAELQLDLIKRATEMTIAKMSGNVAASTEIAKLKQELGKTILASEIKLRETTKAAPTDAMGAFVVDNQSQIGDIDPIMTNLKDVITSFIATAGSLPEDQVKLGAQLNGMFVNLGLGFDDVMKYMETSEGFDSIKADLAPIYNAWTNANVVLADQIKTETDHLAQTLSAGTGDAGKIFSGIYKELYQSVYGKSPDGTVPGSTATNASGSSQPTDSQSTEAHPSPSDLTEIPGDDDIDRMIAYHERNLAEPNPAPATQYIKSVIVGNPNFNKFKSQYGFTSNDQAMKALLGVVRNVDKRE